MRRDHRGTTESVSWLLNTASSVIPHRGGEVWGLHLIAASDSCSNLAELVLGRQDAATDDLWIGNPAIADGKLSISDRAWFWSSAK